MIIIAKWIIILFGAFIIYVGLLMFFTPEKARSTLMKAGSTNFINYGEITMRMIVSLALIIYSDFSKYPEVLNIFGWFMLVTSLMLYCVPRKLHHSFSLRSAVILKPTLVRVISPFSLLLGSAIIYSVV
jgi:hypothetical protein